MSKVHAFLPKLLTSKIISDAFWPLNRACMRVGLNRELDECLAVIAKDERAHRRMGARFTNGQAKYRLSVDDTARFWVLRTLADINVDTLTADELSHFNDRWAAVAKFKFAAKRVSERRTGSNPAHGEDHGYDVWAWFKEYYGETIMLDVAPMYWDLLQKEIVGNDPDKVASGAWAYEAPYMGIDYARDIAVRD